MSALDPAAAPAGEPFLVGLRRRLESVDATMEALRERPGTPALREQLAATLRSARRGALAQGLGRLARDLGRAEELAMAGPVVDIPTLRDALEAIRAVAPAGAAPRMGESLTVLVVDAPGMAAALEELPGEPRIEVALATRADAVDRARATAPDTILVDLDATGARDLVERLAHDPLIGAPPIVGVGRFESPEAAAPLVGLGVTRVLARPAPADAVREALALAARRTADLSPAPAGLRPGTVADLAEQLAEELRRGLTEGVDAERSTRLVPVGDGADVLAAVWGAVARVREIVTLRSGGAVRFQGGPAGALPIVPWSSADRRGGERQPEARRADEVPLTGKRALVVDDDPAVVWFVAGTLRAVGMDVVEAHDGQRAFELALRRRPDVVISDVLMPGLDGFALCRQLKRDPGLADVPVVLLSWKEDLLARLRELGAGADGYLKKEAPTSTVVHRVREVLRTHARVEARLASGGATQGRLDGLTPRFLLEVLAAHGADARLEIRDAAFLHRVEVRSGVPRVCLCTTPDGTTRRGPAALASLLGVRAGRFAVTPSQAPLTAELTGTLAEQLAPLLQRARAVLALLAGPARDQVDRVALDAGLVSALAAVTPSTTRAALEALASGHAPRQLVEEGRVGREALDALLVDLAQRGGIRGVEPAALLGGELPPLVESASPAPVATAPAAPVARREHAEDEAARAADAASRERSGSAIAADAFPATAPVALGAAPAVAVAAPPPAVAVDAPAPPAPLLSFALSPEPALASTAAAIDTSLLEEIDAEPLAPSADPLDGRAVDAAVGAPAALATGVIAPAPAPTPAAAAPTIVAPALASAAPTRAEVSQPDDAEPEPLAVALSAPSPAAAPLAAPAPMAPLAPSAAPLPAPAGMAPLAPSAAPLPTPAPAGTLRGFPPVAPAPVRPETPDAEVAMPRPHDPLPLHLAVDSPAPLAAGGDPSPSVGGFVRDPSAPPPRAPLRPGKPVTRRIEFPRGASKVAGTSAQGDPGVPAQGDRAAGDGAAPLSDRARAALRSPAVRGSAAALTAALLSFGALRALTAGAPAADAAAVLSTPAPLDPSTLVPAASAAASATQKPKKGPELVTSAGAVPVGVPEGHGMLEVASGGAHAIYIDGTFSGRGPLRRIPVEPGRHEVRLELDGEGVDGSVEIALGQLARVELK